MLILRTLCLTQTAICIYHEIISYFIRTQINSEIFGQVDLVFGQVEIKLLAQTSKGQSFCITLVANDMFQFNFLLLQNDNEIWT